MLLKGRLENCSEIIDQESFELNYRGISPEVEEADEVYPGGSVVSIGHPYELSLLGRDLTLLSEISSRDIVFISEQPEKLV
jgi:hypothetical protein